VTAGEQLRDARRRHGVSQAQLAKRAGTTQSVISRIERGGVSPSVETLSSLLRLMGEDLELGARERDTGIDRTLIRERLRLSPAERVAYGLEFADLVARNRAARVAERAR
jgi:transcriptional regulator with XRE-family HTH domain